MFCLAELERAAREKARSTQQETLVEEELKQEFMDIPVITEEVFAAFEGLLILGYRVFWGFGLQAYGFMQGLQLLRLRDSGSDCNNAGRRLHRCSCSWEST